MNTTYEDEWCGWLIFAGTMLGIAGLMRFFDGIWAFRYDGVLPEGFEGAIFGTRQSTCGWFYLLVGLLLILSSFAVLSRSQLAAGSGAWQGPSPRSRPSLDALLPGVVDHVHRPGVLTVYALAAHGGRITT